MRSIHKRSPIQILREVFKDPERKPLLLMIWEMISLSFHFRELPVHYIGRYIFKKEAKNIYDYVPNRLSGKIAPFFNDVRLKQVLDNKLYSYLFFSQFGINIPKIVAFNHKNLMAIDGETRIINSLSDFKDVHAMMFEQAREYDCLFLKKIYSSSSGRSSHVLQSRYLENEDSILNEVFQEVVSSEYIFQQKVKQHPDLERLNPSSLNTIRFDSFIDKEGNIEIISGFLKMSTNGVSVDNNTSGGCGVGIDLDSGKLLENGYSKIRISGVGILKEHPVTGVKFKGFQVPMIEEARELVLKSAGLMPGLRLVGWDVGIAENGPLLIEGNSDYGINSNDLMYGGYMANETFRKVLTEFRAR